VRARRRSFAKERLNGSATLVVERDQLPQPQGGRLSPTVRSRRRRSTVAVTVIGGVVATKKQKARAAAAGKESPAKPKPKKKTSRGK